MFRSIEKFKELHNTRTDPTFWAENIIESSRLSKDDRETKHFYAFIMNPKTYSYDHVESSEYRTLGDTIDDNKVDIKYTPYPDYIETQVYKNGDEYTIYNKNNKNEPSLAVVTEHDEKCPM